MLPFCFGVVMPYEAVVRSYILTLTNHNQVHHTPWPGKQSMRGFAE